MENGQNLNPDGTSADSAQDMEPVSNVFSSFLENENNEKEPTLLELKTMLMAMMKQMLKVDLMNCDLHSVKTQQKLILANLSTMTTRVASVEQRIEAQEEKYNKALQKLQVPIIGNEYNNKQYNVLIYNVPVVDINERPATTRDEVKKVFKDVLKIENVNSMKFAAVHRLPASEGKRPPIIARLRSKFDKQAIWDKIKTLNTYNNKQKDDSTKIYMEMNHLPRKLQQDKKSLLDDFKKARKEEKSPKWSFNKKSGEYGYKIGKTFFSPANNFITLSSIDD